MRNLFSTFRRVGSALGTAKAFRKQNLLYPHRRPCRGPRSKAPVYWLPLDFETVARSLHNPRYAGIFTYGRTRQRRDANGRYLQEKLPPEEWCAWIPNAHEGYITQEEYEENLRRLAENARAIGADRRSPTREGPALLQGLVLCGKCGATMASHYRKREGVLIPDYRCAPKETPTCQAIDGRGIDEAIGELLLELMSPMSLEISLTVQKELQERFDEDDQLRRKQVERARYEADLARQRFMHVDPNNRLVAASLEAEWNEKLKVFSAEQQEYERRVEQDRKVLSQEHRAKVLALAKDFPRIWKDPQTPNRDRKRMVRLLIEDVTLRRGEEITAHIRFKAGQSKTLTLPLAQSAPDLFRTKPQIVQEVDRLLDHHPEEEVADLLNQRGLLSARGQRFTLRSVDSLRRKYRLKSRSHRLRDAGYLTATELARKLNVAFETLKRWENVGLLKVQCHYTRSVYEDPTHGTELPPEEVRDSLRLTNSM